MDRLMDGNDRGEHSNNEQRQNIHKNRQEVSVGDLEPNNKKKTDHEIYKQHTQITSNMS